MPVDVPRPPDRPPSAPRVSVVVPTYNYGRFLTECVESVLSQAHVDVDVIIVDDASTDDTAAVGFALAARDDRVRMITHPENKGHITTFNEGLFEAQGTYVVLLDADDVLAPGSLARSTALPGGPTGGRHGVGPAARVHRRDAAAHLVQGPQLVAVVGPRLARGPLPQRVQPHHHARDRDAHVGMRDTGGMKHARPHTADFELWMQMAARAEVGRVNGPVQAYYRVHPDSMQRTIYAGVLTDLRGRWGAFDAVFAGDAGRFPDADQLHDAARRAIAGWALDLACRAYDRGHTTRSRSTSWSSWPC